jgi:hypothetical protein
LPSKPYAAWMYSEKLPKIKKIEKSQKIDEKVSFFDFFLGI